MKLEQQNNGTAKERKLKKERTKKINKDKPGQLGRNTEVVLSRLMGQDGRNRTQPYLSITNTITLCLKHVISLT